MAAPSFKKLQSATYGKIANQQHVPLQDLVKPHIESFNYVLKEGLSVATRNIHPMEFEIGDGERVSFSYRDATIGRPTVARSNRYAATLKVFPSECRQRGTTYRAKLQASVVWKTSKGRQGVKDMVIGEVPIMVKSDNCNLNTLTPSQLIRHGEEAEEMGGYFIVNGIERVIRMLVMSRRNYPMAISRPKWKARGQAFTELGVTMRCVKDDQTSTNLVLHYMNNGNIVLSFTCSKETFFIALATVLKALVDTTDQHIYNELLKGKEDDTFLIGCVTEMLRQAQAKDLTTQHSILTFIGEQFRVKLGVPDWYTPEEVAKVLIRQHICIHLDSNVDKFNTLILMARKLFSFARGQCSADNADSPMNQEVLLAGHLYQMVLKEKMEYWLITLKLNLLKKVSNSSTSNFIVTNVNLTPIFQACRDVTRPMEYLLATGNVVSKTGLGLMQASGVTVVADKLNFMRFVSHFRCVHRGSFFSEMRTTSVRKLLPEAWGFLCPVHTPDGAPCGLMNHLTATCQITNSQPITSHLARLLCSLGMAPLDGPAPGPVEDCYEVVLDGRVIGMVHKELATELDVKLRTLKATEDKEVPSSLEVVLIPMTKHASQYPGLFLFTTPARFMRPVLNLATQSTQLIGSLEQVYLNIAVTPEEIHPGITSHMELSESSILSVAASLTPFSDFNQSPRNMYQCQMGKQTMGVSSHTLKFRNDHKMYHLQTPQSPIVRPLAYDHYNFDEYPLGTNAIVAVISYTGYDMEDAMILNKSSVERGFCHGTIYKTEEIDLRKKSGGLKKTQIIFGCDVKDPKVQGKLDSDGFPPVGTVLQPGDPFYGYQDLETKTYKVQRYTGMETGIVDNVKLTGEEVGNQEGQKAYIQLRIQRNPIIGDKFSSRHGQKGICSQRWPAENMPFTESGMTPDIIFNPHGFPSRMTIGMMIESMAGKSGSLHGLCHDATPFTFSEDQPAVDYFGRLLKAAGYNYYGTEKMYSGVTGVELEAEIFFGVVYYQRLRHMVSDKFQVRSTGPIDVLTHQPIKGRKRAGGIRFGEMERDSLLAHGTSFLLQDRLLNCSDKSMSHICTKCGTILGINVDKQSADQDADGISSALFGSSQKWTCGTCQSADNIDVVTIPYVFQYLVAELSAMNIKVKLDVK